MDQLITIVVVLIVSAIATLMKRMRRSDDATNPRLPDRTGQSRPSPAPPPQRRETSWEEELRRLLEGESTVVPPPMRPSLPPVTAAPPPRKAPAPLLVNPPRQSVSKPWIAPVPVPSAIEVSAERLAPLDQSRQTYERASQLDVTTSAHINRVAGEHVQLTTVVRKPISGEAAQALALFKTARTARQAVLASIILGPPKAMGEPSALF